MSRESLSKLLQNSYRHFHALLTLGIVVMTIVLRFLQDINQRLNGELAFSAQNLQHRAADLIANGFSFRVFVLLRHDCLLFCLLGIRHHQAIKAKIQSSIPPATSSELESNRK
ncbi:hypothetical protein QMZ65_22700 [Pantoea sp. EABMAA-21]|nr:hypothetical protein [Pantoea sp. EABMAA-21]